MMETVSETFCAKVSEVEEKVLSGLDEGCST